MWKQFNGEKSATDAMYHWLPVEAPSVDDDATRYKLIEDHTLPPGTWAVSDGMVAPGRWGFLLRASRSVIRAVRQKWPALSDEARAYALMVLVEEAD